MVSTGSPKWAEKRFRMAAYAVFVMSLVLMLATSYMKYVQDKPLEARLEKAHKVSLGVTPTFMILVGFMMYKSASKLDVQLAMKPSVNKIQSGLAGLSSVQ
jgi:hypothetical protein